MRALVFAVLLSGANPSPAEADHASLHATASGDVAATDNVFSVGGAGVDREADVFFQVRPGLRGTYETPRMIHNLIAELEVMEYIQHSDKPSLTVRGGWQAFFTPGPRSTAGFSVGGSTGRVNGLTTRTTPDQAPVVVTPAGSSELRQADASQIVSWQSTKETRTSENAFARWTATNDDLAMPTTTNSFEGGLTLGFDRSFQHDTVGLQVGGSFARLERLPSPGVMGARLDRQLNPMASAQWRHDLGLKWSTAIDAGVVYINPVGTDPHNPTQASLRASPYLTFGAVLAYTDVWGHASLAARRTVSPNLYIAQNTVNEGVIAQVAMPLPWLDPNPHQRSPKLAALGSLGFERTQLVDPTTAALSGTFDLARIDAGLEYTPKPGQTYGLRYELAYQHGDTTATQVTPSFYRNTVLFTFAVRYPADLAVEVPRTASVRADRSDLSPVGAEPVVPDAAAPAEPQ